MKRKLQLRLHPDPVLREQATPLADIDRRVRSLMKGMAEIMYACEGIGMAAPQVGVSQRVIVADIGEGLLSLANPMVIYDEGEDDLVEGCLSLPEVRVNVRRKTSIIVRGITADGKEIEWDAHGLMARVIQHEIDHLNGVLIVDHGPVIVEPEYGQPEAPQSAAEPPGKL